MLVDPKFDGLGDLISGGVRNRESVGGGFPRGDIQAAGVGRPDLAGRGIESDNLGVGDVVAELRGFAGVDCSGRDVEAADGEFRAA